MNYKNNSTDVIWIILFSWLLTVGCGETFEPWEENDQYHFSIFGYLDASADTQWVRVMPVREEFFLDPDRPLDATVTLEHVESGESVIMNDSLFGYVHDRYAYNYWTTFQLKPGQTYRIVAKRQDTRENQSSYVKVSLPEDFPVPLVYIERRGRNMTPIKTTVYIQGVERLADIQTIYRTPNAQDRIMMSHLQDSVRTAFDHFQIQMDPQEDFAILDYLIPLPPGVNSNNFLDTPEIKQHIFIASVGPDYHFFSSIDKKVEGLPEGVSNVVNGTGYLAGILSKTIPHKSCFEEGTTILIPCELELPPW